jgi:hypothetical protein
VRRGRTRRIPPRHDWMSLTGHSRAAGGKGCRMQAASLLLITATRAGSTSIVGTPGNGQWQQKGEEVTVVWS